MCLYLLFLFRSVSRGCSYCQISRSRMCVPKMTEHTTQRIKKYLLHIREKRMPLLCALGKIRNDVCSTPRCMSLKRVLQHTYVDIFKGGHRRKRDRVKKGQELKLTDRCSSVSQGCWNKVPQISSFKQQKFIVLHFWKLEVQGQGVDRVGSL